MRQTNPPLRGETTPPLHNGIGLLAPVAASGASAAAVSRSLSFGLATTVAMAGGGVPSDGPAGAQGVPGYARAPGAVAAAAGGGARPLAAETVPASASSLGSSSGALAGDGHPLNGYAGGNYVGGFIGGYADDAAGRPSAASKPHHTNRGPATVLPAMTFQGGGVARGTRLLGGHTTAQRALSPSHVLASVRVVPTGLTTASGSLAAVEPSSPPLLVDRYQPRALSPMRCDSLSPPPRGEEGARRRQRSTARWDGSPPPTRSEELEGTVHTSTSLQGNFELLDNGPGAGVTDDVGDEPFILGPSLATASTSLESTEEHRTLRQARLAAHMRGQLRHGGHVLVGAKAVLGAPHDNASPSLWWENEPGAPGPVTMRVMHSTVQSLRRGPGVLLPALLLARILCEGERALKRVRNSPVSRIAVPKPEPGHSRPRLVVVGDTHGQLEDVLWIFHKHGLPSTSVAYLFNGDIADRGNNALEIFALALGYMSACPGSVYVNRGSHEDEMMNHGPVGGFYDECLSKYGPAVGGKIYEQMRRIYGLLPLAAILNKSVFVVHGGLSRCPNLLSMLDSVHDRGPTLPLDPHDAREQVLVDALWSDPSDKPGLSPSSRGGNIVCFGADVTQAFLRESGLSLVVRSHEVPPNLDGVYKMHGGRMVTLFSASNYCGSTGNQGAVLIFYDNEGRLSYDVSRHFAPDFKSGIYWAPREAESPAGWPLQHDDSEAERSSRQAEVAAVQRAMQRDPTNARLHRDVLGQVARLVVEHKAEIWAYLFRYDQQKSGFVDTAVWLDGCRSVIGDLPWVLFQKILVVEEQGTGQVDYFAFLQRFRVGLIGEEVSDRWGERLLAGIYSRILENDLPMRQLLEQCDRDGNGTVTIPELQEVFASLDMGITRRQAAALMRTISAHASMSRPDRADDIQGGINAVAFLSRFEMVYRPLAEHRELPPWVAAALKRLGRHIWKHSRVDQDRQGGRGGGRVCETVLEVQAQEFFERVDINGDGVLSYDEFAKAVGELSRHAGDGGSDGSMVPELTEPELLELAQHIDINRQGLINYLEFLSGFAPSDFVAGQAFHVDLLEHICTIVWANKPALLSSFLLFDDGHTGSVTRAQLSETMRALNLSIDSRSPPLTEEQIQTLVDHTRFDATTNLVRYRNFLDSFQVFDTSFPPR